MRRDPRLHDNPALAVAAAGAAVIPLFVLDPTQGSEILQTPRRAFFRAGLRALDELNWQRRSPHARAESLRGDFPAPRRRITTADRAMSRHWLVLGVFILVCLGAGALGSWFTTPSLDGWYAGLCKPSWNPPDRIFAPVWTTLYLLMAVAAWLVWRRAGFTGGRTALAVFVVQLVLNVAWSALFFGMRNPGAAFLEIVLLWLVILATVAAFRPVSRTAAWLLVPYLGWVTFAGALNFAIWRLNL